MPVIQYVSDIHLETRNNMKVSYEDIVKPSAPYLALCGDIGNFDTHHYEKFLKYCSDNFQHVFYVPGNHEFYNGSKESKFLTSRLIAKDMGITESELQKVASMLKIETVSSILERIARLCDTFPNVHLLNRNCYHVPETNLYIVGCTLWSSINIHQYCIPDFNDFRRICVSGYDLLTCNKFREWHEECLKFIKDNLYYLTKDETAEVVVITHHCPTYDILDDKYTQIEDEKNINSFFASQLDYLFGYNIKAWLCGHTHGCKKITKNGTIIATNTYGYNLEDVEGFSNSATIEF